MQSLAEQAADGGCSVPAVVCADDIGVPVELWTEGKDRKSVV